MEKDENMQDLEIMQGLIPAAGSGTRLGPFTNAIPKELLPVGDKAVIEHVVESLKVAGITDIVIVVSPKKHGLSDYFGSGARFDVNITYVVQDERLGLADAVAAGKHVITGPFAVVLGDNYFYPKEFLKDLVNVHKQSGADATLGVCEVSDVTRHGIIKVEEGRIVDVVEKPSVEDAPSNLGLMGAYVFEPVVFDAISKTEPGFKGEFQLTDSIKILIDEGYNVIYEIIDGGHIDVGTPEDLMKANQQYLSMNGYEDG